MKHSYISDSIIPLSIFLIILFFLYIGICCFIKRLRDVNQSPYLSLIAFVPIASFCLWIYLAITKSKNNQP